MPRLVALRGSGLSLRRRRGVLVKKALEADAKLLRPLVLGVVVAAACAAVAWRESVRVRAGAPKDAFWRAGEAATWAAEAAAPAGRACPRTWVYELPRALRDDAAPPRGPGDRVAPGVYVPREAVRENANLLEVIVARLSAPGARCAAASPEDAELFLVPVLPRAKHWGEWVEACARLRKTTFTGSSAFAETFWRKALPHLDDETARRHFFVFPRVAYRAGKGCENPNFKGSYLGRFPLVSADFWTRDHLSERSRP